jgi:hypothetical protein
MRSIREKAGLPRIRRHSGSSAMPMPMGKTSKTVRSSAACLSSERLRRRISSSARFRSVMSSAM